MSAPFVVVERGSFMFENRTIDNLKAATPNAFEEKTFVDWANDVRSGIEMPDIQAEESEKDVISIDGKTVCNSRDNSTGKKAIHMVSALSSQYGLVLGQQKCYEKSNEITAIPALLTMLLIEGSVITIDAMGCQKDIAESLNISRVTVTKALQGHSDIAASTLSGT